MRGRKIVILAHCCLNQNAVLFGWERAKGAFSLVETIVKMDIGLIQLPCPESLALGIARPPLSYKDYNKKEHRALCAKLVNQAIDMLKIHRRANDKILGVIGIAESPNCAIFKQRGVFMEIFIYELQKEGFDLPYIEVPTSYRATDLAAVALFERQLIQWLKENN